MKRSLSLIGIFLVATVLAVACTPKPAPTVPKPTQNVTGVLTDVTAQPGGGAIITVQTPQGNTSVPVTPSTNLELNGQICTIDQLAALEVANVSYNCTSVYYMDENGQYVTVGVNVTKIIP